MNKFFIVLIALFALVLANNEVINPLEGIEFLNNFLPKYAGEKYCPTEDVYKWKKAMRSIREGKARADCAVEGNCDLFQERNKWAQAPIQIKLFINVICFTADSCPGGVNRKTVSDQILQINADFNGTNVSFYYDEQSLKFAVDPEYAEIAAYGVSNLWYAQLTALKNRHAYKPDEYLNIFVTGQKSGSFGTLLGIGTFPWDPEASQNTGGLWVNANYFGDRQKTAAHEIGHNLGLWHTFHGDSEVSCNSACYETVHTDFGDDTISNTVGDFCADTPAQPMNYQCTIPTGRDCKGTAYNSIGSNPALYNNFMAYTPDSCYTTFTNQQSMRSSCWICDRLSKWVEGQCPNKK